MTPMIDVVFQMIIFFVCTIEMEKQALSETVVMAHSPHGPEVEQKIPGTIHVDVEADGTVKIQRVALSYPQFTAIIRKSVAAYGRGIPVVIRADGNARHEKIREVMDACKGAGLWKVKFAAVKDSAPGKKS